MGIPFLDIAGLALNVGGSILGAQEARRRTNAMKAAARRLFQTRERDFNTAMWLQRENASKFQNDPRRANLRSMWEDQLAHPYVIDPGQLSTMKATAMSDAARNAGQSVTALREQAQRAGIRSSPAALGMESSVRSSAFGRNLGISNQLDLQASRLNTERADSLRGGYANYLSGDLQTELGMNENLIQLLASKQYDPSTILAFM